MGFSQPASKAGVWFTSAVAHLVVFWLLHQRFMAVAFLLAFSGVALYAYQQKRKQLRRKGH